MTEELTGVNTQLGTLDFVAHAFSDNIPGVEWEYHDDLCDCTYQRIGFWTNPYIGEHE